MERYEFGSYRMDADERLLHRGEELVSLPPKAAATLLILLQNAGRMVDKTALMKAVWPDTFVEEGVITRNISLLRKTLGDTTETSAFIETIPKRGYRFIAPVHVGSVEFPDNVAVESTNGTWLHVEEAAQLPEVSRHPPRPRVTVNRAALTAVILVALAAAAFLLRPHRNDGIFAPPSRNVANVLAILPFRSLEKDGARDYFADGTTQAVITSLAGLQNLRVVSLASDSTAQRDTAAWAAILRDQAVRRVLAGSVLRSGGRVRIDAQLIDPATRAVYWAKSYERDDQNVLALQSAVAEAIAAEIQVNMTERDREHLRRRGSVKPGAMDAYLQGRYFWNRRTEEGLRRAVRYFEQAIAIDPGFAVAYTGLADSYSLLGSIGTDGMPPNEAMPLARKAALKALELDPQLDEAHVSLGYVLLSYGWDLPGAAREFAKALALNPNSATGRHWYSHYFMAAGDLSSASREMRTALQLEPLSPSINIGIGWCLYYSRQYDQAIERFRSVAETDPSLPLAHQTLGMAYEGKGQLDLAIEEFKRAAAFSNNDPASIAALASAYASQGKLQDARQELALLHERSRVRYVPAFYFASVYYAMGDLGKTFEWGWKAIGERCDYLIYLRVEPRVGRLAANPEFLRAMATLHKK